MWLCYKATKIIYDYLGISDNIAINIHKEGHAVIEEDIKYMVQYIFLIQKKLVLEIVHSTSSKKTMKKRNNLSLKWIEKLA